MLREKLREIKYVAHEWGRYLRDHNLATTIYTDLMAERQRLTGILETPITQTQQIVFQRDPIIERYGQPLDVGQTMTALTVAADIYRDFVAFQQIPPEQQPVSLYILRLDAMTQALQQTEPLLKERQARLLDLTFDLLK